MEAFEVFTLIVAVMFILGAVFYRDEDKDEALCEEEKKALKKTDYFLSFFFQEYSSLLPAFLVKFFFFSIGISLMIFVFFDFL
ncbi:hypothetical protein IC620_03120 [Hazenella sp. IB182357]|uniref:Uncharacterized protein n=1 Tax=Polycladospora coralii TaxID=2771432 RepID=A0A926NA16_9BACL|nr:hypothetical protein [Polycladospora coralii]MBD1371345.1 hypothetical protein [Polycladospora coralii]MBS7530313.1 hypothetical protein [Polycladospora coralii]